DADMLREHVEAMFPGRDGGGLKREIAEDMGKDEHDECLEHQRVTPGRPFKACCSHGVTAGSDTRKLSRPIRHQRLFRHDQPLSVVLASRRRGRRQEISLKKLILKNQP
ncbi:MAG: hypothetical protein AAF844_16580, partial [Pseudomonadota bacterium]